MSNKCKGEFKKGDQIDVYSKKRKAWLLGIIVNVKNDNIKIHHFGWEDVYDIWLKTTSRCLAPLNTHTLPIIEGSEISATEI